MRRTLALFLVFVGILTFAGLGSIAVKAAKPSRDVAVTTSLADFNAAAQPYSLQSDGGGPYQNGVAGVVSVLLADAFNNQTWGDWRLDLTAQATSRNVGISFCDPAHGTTCPLNAVQPGDPGYTAPANPPFWGTQWQPLHLQAGCTVWNRNMLTMRAGDAFPCSANISFPAVNNVYYVLILGTLPNPAVPKPEVQQLQVTCTSSGADGNCSGWFLDPIPVVNADGSTSPGQTRARLQRVVTKNNVGYIVSETNEGDFYLTFHIPITRP